jgi:hypothetical protein
MISSRQRNLFNFYSIFFAIAFCVSALFVEPSHFHLDGRIHSDCSICISQQQPAENELQIYFPVLNIVRWNMIPEEIKTCPYQTVFDHHSRAPPAVLA